MHRYPEVDLSLLGAGDPYWHLMACYEDLSSCSVLARAAKLLLDLSKLGRQPINRREHSNTDMASQISTVPEAFSRSLKTFKKTGDIICTRTTITVRALKTLAKLAEISPAVFKG